MENRTESDGSGLVDPFFGEGALMEAGADFQAASAAPGCLTFARARELALNSVRWTREEQSHAADCPSCTNLVARFERSMPHLSLWLLIRRRLGLPLQAVEEHAIQYHLVEGGCRECGERDRRAGELLPNVTVLRGALPIPAAPGVQASTAPAATSASASGGALDAELALERGRLGLEVRTRNDQWKHQLVGWTLATRREREARERFAVLYPDVEGWFVDHSWLDAEELGLGANNPCQEILAAAMDVELLTDAQRESIVGLVWRLKSAEQRSAWRDWAVEQQLRGQLGAHTRDVLQRILQLTAPA
ncbi:MAG: hypothetical protein ACO1SX_09420 [Actinomycetota bacterium]